MALSKGRITERTLYAPLMECIRAIGGTAVSEVSYNSEPDIQFDLGGNSWLLSVKIGDDSKTVKDAFLQYWRHKAESSIQLGLIAFFPKEIRRIKPVEATLQEAIQNTNISTIIDANFVREELRDRAFPGVLKFLQQEVLVRLLKKQTTYYPLSLVIKLLQEQVAEMMDQIQLSQDDLLRIITDKELLKGIGHLEPKHTGAVAQFLASYIYLSQILFFRLLAASRSDLQMFLAPPRVSRSQLRQAFKRIRDIHYRAIYEIDILDAIADQYLVDTFDLIWRLQIENVRYELPGRIFHELMPSHIRKLLAAFYTRPLAAELLSHLTISQSDQIVFDPACGSGTILTSAYRRKLELWRAEGKRGSPHKRFCEQDINGADIMPFAVHLTSANLSAMEPATSVELTRIIRGDSLRLVPNTYPVGMQLDLFPATAKGQTPRGREQTVHLESMDVILMNPPFTKVERGIQRFVEMGRFAPRCGGEVGLWGHFITLADVFLKENGIFGAVLPVNVLRGRESEKVRRFLFEEWTTLYILKPTRNYGFSEWSEYRDVLFIARKQKPKVNHQVKFCLIRKDLTQLTDEDVKTITSKVERQTKLRDDDLVDVDSFALSEIKIRLANMMWFCGVTSFSHRDAITDFVEKFTGKLDRVPDNYFREGYRPVPKGVSQFLFLTRHLEDSRIEQAFLRFSKEGSSTIAAQSALQVAYEIERGSLTPTLRTPVGLQTMDLNGAWDYITHRPYNELKRVCRAVGRTAPKEEFWTHLHQELRAVETNLVVNHRINPFSPATHLNAFFSSKSISPSNQFNVIVEPDHERAKSVCILLNSILFWAQFFLLKEESTGRYINIRFYDLEEMAIYPKDDAIPKLIKLFQEYKATRFPALREQFDENFEQRYKEFWEMERGSGQQRLFGVLGKPIEPAHARLNFDLAVCQALGVTSSKTDLIKLYEILVNEMIITKGLIRD